MNKGMKYKIYRIVALVLFFVFGIETFAPIGVYALTSGPSTPEVQSFEPASTDQMVDLFTGDFNYNIPLFELPGPNGGYPFNLAYHSGIGMDQEASWVGLGWNINAGAINRDVRAYADDFHGDEIKTRQDIKTNWTVGVKGGVNLELFGADFAKGTGGKNGGMSLGLSLYYNSYKGMGYSLDAGVNYHGNGTKSSSGIGLNLSMDSQEGASLRPALTLSDKTTNSADAYTSLNVSVGINSRRGLTDISLGIRGGGGKDCRSSENVAEAGSGKVNWQHNGTVGNNSTISFSATAYAPSIDLPMSGSNLSMTFKLGYAETALLSSFYVGAYYTEQHIKNQNKVVGKNAYGYLNFQDAGKEDLTDYYREKDGIVRDQTPNLAIPNIAYDAYNVLGQGVGGMFRPYRTGVTTVYDAYKKSVLGGGALGLEIGIGSTDVPHFGIDASVNVTKSTSGIWENYSNSNIGWDANRAAAPSDFPEYEQTYFKMLGESTTTLEESGSKYYSYINNDQLVLPSDASKIKTHSNIKKRVPRNSVVQPFKNKELYSDNRTDNTLPEYNVKYFENVVDHYEDIKMSGKGATLDRTFSGSASKQDHIGAYSVVQGDGSRYIYGLPVYNLKQVDALYSCDAKTLQPCDDGPIPSDASDAEKFHKVKGTDQYLNWTETPGYTTSHMLTNILGADYVDVDDNGPSDNDFGYWVKFNYVKVADASDPYKWKAPFENANLMKGNRQKLDDDKASYTYGEKEIYNLATAETKTHIAVFVLAERKDGLGVSTEYQNDESALGTKRLYRVKKIELYEKSNYFNTDGTVSSGRKPITTVHFQYSYKLCDGIPNFDASASGNTESDYITPGTTEGKLTLEKVWFTYERSSKGELSPYVFHYSDNNPYYGRRLQDRWGNYKSYAGTNCDRFDFPYVNQTGTDANYDAQAWNLTAIETPSGSRISVNYESDDYSHVQNKVAGQMFKIASVENTNGGVMNSLLFGWKATDPAPNNRVFFELERPTDDDNELRRYFDDLKTPDGYQLYYKIRIWLRSQTEPIKEDVSGYARFNLLEQGEDYGFDENSIVSGKYTRAWIKLSPPELKRGTAPEFHPFSVAAWQYLKVSMPDECAAPGKLNTEPGTKQSAKDIALKLVSAITSIRDIFTNYYNRCKRLSWGRKIELNNSWIRLCSPDRTKYGGGIRVSKITIEDSWDKDFEGASDETEYGVVYDYKTKFLNEDGSEAKDAAGNVLTMSSGVAAYEPMIGGDEISLRYAKMYTEAVPLKANNDLFFEFPINEGYFPGPVVGYSKVTVRSLASDKTMKHESGYAGIPTTGQVVHEFYTAKDFPVITEESNLADTRDPFHLFIPLPFLGEIKIDNMNAEQAYKIELNDMHGRPKKVSYYGQNESGNIIGDAISYVEYTYKCTDYENVNLKKSKKLNNNVSVLSGDRATPVVREMGVDYDFFTDLRYSYTRSGQGGVSINSDILNFFVVVIPAFVPWPNISYSQVEAKLAVSNKIIHRSGILEKTTAYDGGTTVTTSNLYYDMQTGRPVLSTVDNNYNDPIYKYNIPAHWVYDGMGPAYKNIGYKQSVTFVSELTSGSGIYNVSTTTPNLFVLGDELIIESGSDKYLGNVIGKYDGASPAVNLRIAMDNPPSGFTGSHDVTIVRSGRRNQLTTDIGNIVALKNPLERVGTMICNSNSNLPVGPGGAQPVPIPDEWIQYWQLKLDQDVNGKKHWPIHTSRLTSDVSAAGSKNWTGNNLSDLAVTNPSIATGIQNWWHQYFNQYTDLKCIAYGISEPMVNGGSSNCIDPGGISCGYNAQLALIPTIILDTTYVGNGSGIMSEIGIKCFKWLKAGTSSSSSDYGGVVEGSWYNTPVSGVPNSYTNENLIGPRYITSLTRYDDYRFKVEFEDGGEIVSSFLFPGTLCGSYTIPTISVSQCSASDTVTVLDSVLSASSIRVRNNWVQNFRDIKPEVTLSSNMYKTGELGNWKPYETYAYVEDRDKSTPSSLLPIDLTHLRRDGTFSSMPMFSWNNPTFTVCAPEWRLGNTVTQYNSFGYETENRNILNNYSAALYSYNGKLSVAVSNNAKSTEIGFEGFEEYMTNNITPFNNSTGHLTFVNSSSSYLPYRTNVYNVSAGYNSAAELDVTNSVFSSYYNGVSSLNGLGIKYNAEARPMGGNLFYTAKPYESIVGSTTITNVTGSTDDYVPMAVVNLSSPAPDFASDEDRCWTGKLQIDYPLLQFDESYDGKISFTSDKAHTGRMSMRVIQEASFPQFDLNLESGKQYVFGAWIHNPLTALFPPNKMEEILSGDDWGIQIGYGKLDGSPITVVGNFRPSGSVIDEWQRIEGVFTTPSDLKVDDVWFIVVKPVNGTPFDMPIYIDDVRIHPFDASFQSYVYNPKDYKLIATLDANNFATLYNYDSEGMLFLVRRETEKGIMTVEETKSNLKH